MCWTEDNKILLLQHDGQAYCHKPCYAVLFGPKGMKGDTGEKYICYICEQYCIYRTFIVYIFAALATMSRHGVLFWFFCVDEVFPSSGVNTGGAGSYIYDDPAAETQP